MTLRDWMMQVGQQQDLLLWIFGGVPALSLLGFLLPKPVRYQKSTLWLYSIMVHISSIPGMFALALLAYSLFFTRENLLDVNVMVYFLPPLSMALTLFLLRQQISFTLVPGFGRLLGLMGLMGLSFLGMLLLNKLFVGIFFGGSIVQLIAIGFGVYLLVRWLWGKLVGKK